MGGTWRDDTNSPANLVILCGTGTEKCHGFVEANRFQALGLGLLVRQHMTPSQMPLEHAVHGSGWLTDDGEFVTERPVMSA
jgi:hypothetical protein